MSKVPALTIAILAPFAVLAFATSAIAQSKIEYGSVAQARKALLANPEAKAKKEGEWLIITVRQPNTAWWTFTPSGHEAHPAVAKRTIVEKDGRFNVQTNMLCEAAKLACDRLFESFKALNARMMESIKGRQ